MTRNPSTGSQEAQTIDHHDEVVADPDELLLRRFLARSGASAEAAFATLIDRHGPIVHRICLDVLHDRDEASDAAQAVFLILAKKAGSIRKPGSLGPWLHGVALRVARRARIDSVRRRSAEREKAELTRRETAQSGPDPMDSSDLHDAVDRLPDHYRQPIILCYLLGQSQAEAAESLGWPLGTVQIRLHRGREKLRSRLSRQGAGMLGLTAFALLESDALGAAWTRTTARSAVRFADGKATTGLASPTAIQLAERVLPTMLNGPMKVVGLVAVVLMIAATGLLSNRMRTAEPAPPTSEPAPTPIAVKPAAPPQEPRPPQVILAAAQPAKRPTAPVVPIDEPVLDTPKSPASPGQILIGVRADEPTNKGLDLFERNWVKDDVRGHGGDGLGPVFNGRSCVACHNLGGTGGAGGADRNIEIVSIADQSMQNQGYFYSFNMDFGSGRMEYRMGTGAPAGTQPAPRIDPGILAAIHPGFRDARSVVLHRFGTDPPYNAWRGTVAGQHGTIMVRTSERNPTPLFGTGLIDAIPDAAIEAAAKRKFAGSASERGRVSRLSDGRIGRFGWKAQTATLKEFILSAAAGEMGLEVPDRRQAADPRLPGLGASGLDMNQADCDALSAFVHNLPAPVATVPDDAKESAQIKSGADIFKSIGCTHCHMPKLGDVDGLYSDLLLHDMSARLEDAETYAIFVGDPPRPAAAAAPDRLALATVREWRTPPLWGLRDSAPYLHDGRAATIDQSIALHAGQGAASAKHYAALSPRRKANLIAFLNSLTAPPAKR